MQVNASHKSDSASRMRQRLQDQAGSDRNRADSLETDGIQDQFRAGELREEAADNRKKGEDLKKESERMRRNGRDQSRGGLERLSEGSERYSEAFQKQEKGLGDLQNALSDLQTASQAKEGALGKINAGLDEQTAENTKQQTSIDSLSKVHNDNWTVIHGKESSANTLGENIQARGESLNTQTEKIADFLIAGGDYNEGSQTKQTGVDSLKTAVGHRVQAESLNDAKSKKDIQKDWAEQDADRHEASDRKFHVGSILEDLKARAARANASFHDAAANRGEQTAAQLSAQAAEMRAQADATMGHARSLEHCGQHHVAVGRQMQCCPWTYCQGVELERRGMAEIAEAQRLKAQAQSMRSEAQAKALEAEEARVKAEQARSVADELKVTAHGNDVRSDIFEQRAASHAQSADRADAYAEKTGQEAQQLGEASAQEMTQAREHHSQGTTKIDEGMDAQREALGKQQGAVAGFDSSVASEKGLQQAANEEVSTIGSALVRGRSFIGRGRSLQRRLTESVAAEKTSHGKVSEGIGEFRTGLASSQESAAEAKSASELLSEARELELEGLRLQNRGQKMLLEARPKMAQAAKLSAESFDAYKKAQNQEKEAQELIERGTQKLDAAEILRTKAAAYEDLAKTV